MDTSAKYEAGDEYDPSLDFAQFLKEAKTHASLRTSQEADTQEFGGKTKPKKSWKSSILQWLKTEKKNIVQQPPPALKTSYTKSNIKRGYVSGPVNGSTAERPTSGPLFNFNQRKRTDEEESQMPPYISLSQLNGTRDLRSYGPVYLVT